MYTAKIRDGKKENMPPEALNDNRDSLIQELAELAKTAFGCEKVVIEDYDVTVTFTQPNNFDNWVEYSIE